MLNGISDDKLNIGPQCISFLEEHGVRMREALKAMGDLEPEEEEEKENTQPNISSKASHVTDTDMKTTSSQQEPSLQHDDAMEEID